QLMKEWSSPIYTFFSPTPHIQYMNDRCCHVFKCLAKGCRHHVQHFLDTSDKSSTSNMWKHVKSCWGDNILSTILDAKDLVAACCEVQGHIGNASITMAFERKGREKVTYSHRQHSKSETRYEHITFVI
ncbi:hypothetical protein SCLCIDRAFT_1146699, partial [Scleroderma citrinum Foug A]